MSACDWYTHSAGKAQARTERGPGIQAETRLVVTNSITDE